jgi:GT2 family glycosyltransferase
MTAQFELKAYHERTRSGPGRGTQLSKTEVLDVRVAEPKVTVIIPNWNGMDHIQGCLESLLKIDYHNVDVIVVDNNSEDGSPKAIAESFPKVQIMRNSENLGFAEGCNVGIRQAMKSGSAYVWLLNNDTLVDRQSLTFLVRAAEKDNSIGMTGSKIYEYDYPNIIRCAGMTINWFRGETDLIGWHQLDEGQFNNYSDVEGLEGCSLLISRRVCEEVGLMDKDYFVYGEEIDWCVRARLRGFRCTFVPESIVFHKGGASSGEAYRPTLSYYSTRNMLRTISKSFSFPMREIYLFTAIVCKLWKRRKDIVKASLVKVCGSKAYEFDVSTFLGVMDFMLNRKGVKDRSAIMSFQHRKKGVPRS